MNLDKCALVDGFLKLDHNIIGQKICFNKPLMQRYTLTSPLYVPSFSLISKRFMVYAQKCKVCEMKKKKETNEIFLALISG